MKIIEYYYNLIYYFFYRATITTGIKVNNYNPFFILTKIYYERPSIKKKYLARGINDPYKYFKKKTIKDRLLNPSLSLGTMYGGGLTMTSLAFTLVGFYKIIKNLLFPDFQDSFEYVVSIAGVCAYFISNLLVHQQDQGEKYIKKFNKIKDKSWRRKWAFITALTFPLSITFMVLTSKSSYIGGFLYAVHQYLFH